MTLDADTARLLQLTHDWDRAMVSNDADAIGRFMADEWIIIGPDGSIDTKERFLEHVRSGSLTHDVMESHDIDVRAYRDAALVVARGVSGGGWQGQRFLLNERVSSMFIRMNGEWQCVSTHLSNLA